jgi:hypothetical protein
VIGRRVLAAGAAGAVVLVVIVAVALSAFHRQPAAQPAPRSAADRATARAVFGLQDAEFDVVVTHLVRDAVIPGAPPTARGQGDVTLQVSFHNRSYSQQRAAPNDFALVAGTAAPQPPVYIGGQCPRWPVADLHARDAEDGSSRDVGAQQTGPTFGPEPLCFSVAGSPMGPLTLVWHPDVAFFLLNERMSIRLQ